MKHKKSGLIFSLNKVLIIKGINYVDFPVPQKKSRFFWKLSGWKEWQPWLDEKKIYKCLEII